MTWFSFRHPETLSEFARNKFADLIPAIDRVYWRLKRRRYRPLRKSLRHRDIARSLQPLISEFFDAKVILDWFQKKPDAKDTQAMEEWQLEALSIVMRFDPFADESAIS